MLCPHLLPPKASATLKCLLQHQPWNAHYVLQLDETDENADIFKAVNEQLEILDRSGSESEKKSCLLTRFVQYSE